MFAAVEFLYKEGFRVKPQWPPAVGQLQSGWERKNVPVLYLWPLEWKAHISDRYQPLAMLWQPGFVAVGHIDLVVRGFEGVPKGRHRRWMTQMWRCEVMDAQRAERFLRPDARFGELTPSA